MNYDHLITNTFSNCMCNFFLEKLKSYFYLKSFKNMIIVQLRAPSILLLSLLAEHVVKRYCEKWSETHTFLLVNICITILLIKIWDKINNLSLIFEKIKMFINPFREVNSLNRCIWLVSYMLPVMWICFISDPSLSNYFTLKLSRIV